jgi:ATP-dependent Clp protease ATP-binding subunit ClpX
MLAADGVSLEVAAPVFAQIAELAIEYKAGARSLRGIFEEMMVDVMYAVPDHPAIKRVEIRSLFEPPRYRAEAPASAKRTMAARSGHASDCGEPPRRTRPRHTPAP